MWGTTNLRARMAIFFQVCVLSWVVFREPVSSYNSYLSTTLVWGVPDMFGISHGWIARHQATEMRMAADGLNGPRRFVFFGLAQSQGRMSTRPRTGRGKTLVPILGVSQYPRRKHGLVFPHPSFTDSEGGVSMGSREGLNPTTPTPCRGLGRRDPELCAQQDSYTIHTSLPL